MRMSRFVLFSVCVMLAAGFVGAAGEQAYSEFPAGTGALFPPATPAPPATHSVRALTFFNDRATWLASPLMSTVVTTFEDFSGTLVPPNNDGTLDFNPPVRGVGIDLISPNGVAVFVIDIYDPAGALLGSTTSTGQPTSAGAFFGVVSDDITGIAQLHFSSQAGDGELFCNVEWAGPPVPVELQSLTIE